MSTPFPTFSTSIPIDISAVNYGGHLGHDRLVSMMHEARLHFFKELGQTEADFFGNGLILKTLNVDYLQEAFWGEALTFRITVSEINRASFGLHYDILRGETMIATADIVLIGFDYQSRKVARLSQEFPLALANLTPSSESLQGEE